MIIYNHIFVNIYESILYLCISPTDSNNNNIYKGTSYYYYYFIFNFACLQNVQMKRFILLFAETVRYTSFKIK